MIEDEIHEAVSNSKKRQFLDAWRRAVQTVCFEDREDDEQLTPEDVWNLMKDGHVTMKDILDAVATELRTEYFVLQEGTK